MTRILEKADESMRVPAALAARLQEHRAAVEAFLARAAAVPAAYWHEPRAPGKWTPAQETVHVGLVYEVLLRELAGGAGARRIGRSWQRWIWRWWGRPLVLLSGRIPVAVRAPGEVVPPAASGGQEELLEMLAARSEAFEVAIRHAAAEGARRGATHPYFGPLSLVGTVRFCNVHIRHHTAFLPAAGPVPAPSRRLPKRSSGRNARP